MSDTLTGIAAEMKAWAEKYLRGIKIQSDAMGFAVRLSTLAGQPAVPVWADDLLYDVEYLLEVGDRGDGDTDTAYQEVGNTVRRIKSGAYKGREVKRGAAQPEGETCEPMNVLTIDGFAGAEGKWVRKKELDSAHERLRVNGERIGALKVVLAAANGQGAAHWFGRVREMAKDILGLQARIGEMEHRNGVQRDRIEYLEPRRDRLAGLLAKVNKQRDAARAEVERYQDLDTLCAELQDMLDTADKTISDLNIICHERGAEADRHWNALQKSQATVTRLESKLDAIRSTCDSD